MEKKKIVIYQALSFGFSAVLHHMSLFFFVLLEALALLAVVIAVAALFNQDLANSIITTIQEATYFDGTVTVIEVARENAFVSLISVLLLSLVFVGFDFGYKKVMLEIYDYNKSSPHVVLSCFNLAPQGIIAWFLYGTLVLCGYMLVFMPGVIVMLRCGFFSYFIIDNNVGPLDALKMSWHVTKGHFWDLFALWLIIRIIIYLGYVSILGWIIIWPLSTLAYVFVYRQLQPKLSV